MEKAFGFRMEGLQCGFFFLRHTAEPLGFGLRVLRVSALVRFDYDGFHVCGVS